MRDNRGMLSDPNLLKLIGEELGFIVAHPLRRNNYAREVIGALYRKFDKKSKQNQFFEDARYDVRFIAAFSPKIAEEVREERKKRLTKNDAWIEEQQFKLLFPAKKGRKPTPQGTYDKIREYFHDHGLLGFYDVTLSAGKVTVKKERKTLLWECKIDGVLMVETTDAILKPE